MDKPYWCDRCREAFDFCDADECECCGEYAVCWHCGHCNECGQLNPEGQEA